MKNLISLILVFIMVIVPLSVYGIEKDIPNENLSGNEVEFLNINGETVLINEIEVDGAKTLELAGMQSSDIISKTDDVVKVNGIDSATIEEIDEATLKNKAKKMMMKSPQWIHWAITIKRLRRTPIPTILRIRERNIYL